VQCTQSPIFPENQFGRRLGHVARPRRGKDKAMFNSIASIARIFDSWKRYGAAMDELSHLSDRELADIGITRGDIQRIAWEQARG
jgi:uncharacterized protein YjiS (DUF1127 family)